MTASTTNHTKVVWEGAKATMEQGSVIEMEVSAMCVVVHGLQSMTPSTIRHGVSVRRSASSPCTMNGAKVGFMLTVRCTRR